MEQITYILFGWLLGLLAPAIVNKIGAEHKKKELLRAIYVELHDLQYRVAIVSFMLGQKYGEITREYLQWIKPIINNYKGNEPSSTTAGLIDTLLKSEEQQYNAILQSMRSKHREGIGLKTFKANFLESNISEISKLPLELQSNIHEFRNSLHTLNEEILICRNNENMTFDSSLTDDNYNTLVNNLKGQYSFMQGMCQRVAVKLETILSSKVIKSNNALKSGPPNSGGPLA